MSPSMWPVAMADAFAVVKVGNSAWLLRRLTPSRAIAAMVGAVAVIDHAGAQAVGDEQHDIVRRVCAGVCAKPVDASVADSSVAPRISSAHAATSRALRRRRRFAEIV